MNGLAAIVKAKQLEQESSDAQSKAAAGARSSKMSGWVLKGMENANLNPHKGEIAPPPLSGDADQGEPVITSTLLLRMRKRAVDAKKRAEELQQRSDAAATLLQGQEQRSSGLKHRHAAAQRKGQGGRPPRRASTTSTTSNLMPRGSVSLDEGGDYDEAEEEEEEDDFDDDFDFDTHWCQRFKDWICCRKRTLKDMGLTEEEHENIKLVAAFSDEELLQMATSFHYLDRKEEGFIHKRAVLHMPELVHCPLKNRIYKLLCKDLPVKLDFPRFVRAFSVFSENVMVDEKVKFLFDMYDVDADGVISYEDMLRYFAMVYNDKNEVLKRGKSSRISQMDLADKWRSASSQNLKQGSSKNLKYAAKGPVAEAARSVRSSLFNTGPADTFTFQGQQVTEMADRVKLIVEACFEELGKEKTDVITKSEFRQLMTHGDVEARVRFYR